MEQQPSSEERALVLLALRSAGSIRAAAARLGMSHTGLAKKMRRLGIEKSWAAKEKGADCLTVKPRNDTPFGEGRDATSKPIVPNANGANPAHGESPAQQ